MIATANLKDAILVTKQRPWSRATQLEIVTKSYHRTEGTVPAAKVDITAHTKWVRLRALDTDFEA